MATGKYDAQVALAKRLLEKYGETAKLVRTTPGAPADVNKPWEPGTPGVTSKNVSAVWLNHSVLRENTLAKEGQIFAIVAASDLTSPPNPALDHVIRAKGARYSIEKSEPLDPSGQDIIYELTAKGVR